MCWYAATSLFTVTRLNVLSSCSTAFAARPSHADHRNGCALISNLPRRPGRLSLAEATAAVKWRGSALCGRSLSHHFRFVLCGALFFPVRDERWCGDGCKRGEKDDGMSREKLIDCISREGDFMIGHSSLSPSPKYVHCSRAAFLCALRSSSHMPLSARDALLLAKWQRRETSALPPSSLYHILDTAISEINLFTPVFTSQPF
uniref:Secreted protein n=1 Tax=Steinernema glaseri TaxID=37863 RepID=A0A1I7ZQT1_9BILA